MKAERLASLDALRGFDMFFITGGAGLIGGLCAALGAGDCWLAQQMHHVPWAGLAHHDTIFPLFLFLAGVSWPFSLASQEAKGRTPGQIRLKVVTRALVLFALGLSFGGILKFYPQFRLMSVLGFIGPCWGLAALVYQGVRRLGARLGIIIGLLLGYFLLLHFCHMPDMPVGGDTYAMEWNVIRRLDLWLYPEHLMIPASVGLEKNCVAYEPESLFSIPNGVALALMGMLAGTLLRSGLTAVRKVLALAATGVGLLALTLLFVYVLHDPIVKALWTTSFILAAGAYAYLMLALFYWLVDVRGRRGLVTLFDCVGKNSILAYMLMMTGVTTALQKYLFTGCIQSAGDWGKFVNGLTFYLITWVILTYCRRKSVFLKV